MSIKFFTFSLSAFIALFFTAMSFGQAVVFEDNFDSYTAGEQLACQNPTDWTTLNLNPCDAIQDAYVSDLYAFSGSNSTVIVQSTDLIKPYGVLTSGKYSIAFMVYIPTGKTGFFSTLTGSSSGSDVVAMGVFFMPDGIGRLDAGAIGAATFTYTYDTWQSVEVIADLDNDTGEFWFDGAWVYTWQWTLGIFGQTIPLQLAVNRFYGWDASYEMYFDDFVFTDLLAPPPVTNFSDDFEAYTAGQQLVAQNNIDWDTWSGGGGTSEDPFVSDNFAYSGSNSVVIAQNNDLIKFHGQLTSGRWYISFQMYIPAGKAGYFNSMSGFTPNPFQWAHEVYFDAGGTGRLIADVTTTFTWLEDTWQLVQVVVDLDADEGQFWIGGVMISSWTWTQGGTNLQLDVNDFFGATSGDEMYMDDFWFGDVQVPVELTSFTANVNDQGNVILNWSTATELNNQMFEIERKSEEGQYVTIGYVNGHGTTTEPQEYSYIDNTVETGTFFYRLKQIDFLGTYEYSDAVEVEVNGPLTFGLDQNYPNPFNPSTIIKYRISETGSVKLSIYNTLGEEVAVLVNGLVQAGFYEVTFDASNLPSGVYFYRLQSGNKVEAKKMILLR